MKESGIGSHTSQITQLTMYYAMEIDKHIKAYYIIIVTNTSSLLYLLLAQQILEQHEIYQHTFTCVCSLIVFMILMHLFMSDTIHFIIYYYIY